MDVEKSQSQSPSGHSPATSFHTLAIDSRHAFGEDDDDMLDIVDYLSPSGLDAKRFIRDLKRNLEQA